MHTLTEHDHNQTSAAELDKTGTQAQNQVHSHAHNPDTSQVLRENFQTVQDDVQALLHATVDQGADKITQIRTNLTNSLQTLKDSFQENESSLLENSKAALKATDEFVQEHPLKTLASVALIGFIAGWFAKRLD